MQGLGVRPDTNRLGKPRLRLTMFYISSNIETFMTGTKAIPPKKATERVAKYADMFSAMGTEPRLRIMQLLLTAHPEGLVVTDIQEELEIPNSTLSHHLDKLRTEDLVQVQREGTFLRYTANTGALQELLQFLYAECCTRNKAVEPEQIVRICR
jgi:ArsR family transcriptional regulator, arsenate/arsenite/antimonite-responsive transcriptional repressor